METTKTVDSIAIDGSVIPNGEFEISVPANFESLSLDANGRVDISKVAGSAVSGVSDFKATGFAVAGDAMDLVTNAVDAASVAADAVTEIQSGLATEVKQDIIDANVDTLLSRITSTLFSGITSMAEWIGLLAGKHVGDSTARTEIRATGSGNGTYDETSHSLEVIAGMGGASGATPQQLWEYSNRSLTNSAVNSQVSPISGTTITIYRGDTFTLNLTGLGSLANRSNLWFTAKESLDQEDDSESVISLDEQTGLIVIEGDNQISSLGSIDVTDEPNGNLTISLSNAATENLKYRKNAAVYWDLQIKTSSYVKTLMKGTLKVERDVTRSS